MLKRTDAHQTWVNIITVLYILTILKQSPTHGHKIAGAIKHRTGGAVSPNPNALYPMLRLLEEKGYVAGKWENPDTRGKRIYELTAEGLAYIPVLRVQFQDRLAEAESRLAVLRRDLLVDREEGKYD